MTLSVLTFMARHRLTLPNKEHWFIVLKQRPGHVNGIAGLRGVPRITNGVMMWLEQSNGQVVEVHRDWFVYDEPESVNGENRSLKASNPQQLALDRKVSKILADLLD